MRSLRADRLRPRPETLMIIPHKRAVAVMLKIEIEREADGRWLAEVPALPGVFAYGASRAEARTKATALALRVIADRIEHGEPVPVDPATIFVAA
jgi:predicted RNase H-like HicB family nuclease